VSAFSIGLREGFEVCLIVAVMGTLARSPARPRPLVRHRVALAASLLLGVASGVVLHRSTRGAPAETVLRVELVVALAATVALASVFVAVGRRLADGDVAPPAAARPGLPPELVVCGIAIWRETVEATLFVATPEPGAAATARAFADVAAGALLALAVVLGTAWLLRPLLATRQLLVVGQTLLGLFAAGMAMEALRAAADLGWLHLGDHDLAVLGWLDAPGAQPLRSGAELVGLTPGMVLVEGLAWLALVTTVTAWVLRSWHMASWTVRRWR
jgi:high-affinity iron transporter